MPRSLRVRHDWIEKVKVAVIQNGYPNQKALSHNIRLLIGKYDKVIQADNMKAFVKEIRKIQFDVIDAGHNDLIPKSVIHLPK